MKKSYVAPSVEITKFETEDVLHNSVITGGGTVIRPGVAPGFGGNEEQIDPS